MGVRGSRAKRPRRRRPSRPRLFSHRYHSRSRPIFFFGTAGRFLQRFFPLPRKRSLPSAKRIIFDRRAPFYLRYLLCEKFGLRTCADIENADLRHLLRSAGFRLIRSSAVPEVAFAGATRGEDPPVRPWKLTLRQELSDDRAAEMLINAALWQIKYGLRPLTLHPARPRSNL